MRTTDPAAIRRELANRPTSRAPALPTANGGGWDARIARAGQGVIRPPPDLGRTGEPALPEPAASKLRAMRHAAEDLDTASRSLSDRRNEAIQDRERWAARHRRLTTVEARFFGPEHPSVVEAATARDAAVAALADLDERIADLRNRAPKVLQGINQYLAGLPHDIVVELAPPVAAPRGATIDSARAQIAELRADLHATRSAPLHSSVAKAAIRASIAKHAGDCPLNVGHIIEGAPVQWPVVLTRGELFGHANADGAPQISGFAQSRQIDTFAVLCWLAGAAIAERLDAEVDATADDTEALSADDRTAKEAELLGR